MRKIIFTLPLNQKESKLFHVLTGVPNIGRITIWSECLDGKKVDLSEGVDLADCDHYDSDTMFNRCRSLIHHLARPLLQSALQSCIGNPIHISQSGSGLFYNPYTHQYMAHNKGHHLLKNKKTQELIVVREDYYGYDVWDDIGGEHQFAKEYFSEYFG